MEFISEEYNRCIGNVVTTTDGYKYVQSKVTEKYIYLKCAIFRGDARELVRSKTPKLGLSNGFKNNHEITRFIRQVMAIPFLPASLIYPTFTLISTPTLENEETEKLTKLKNYVRKHWLI